MTVINLGSVGKRNAFSFIGDSLHSELNARIAMHAAIIILAWANDSERRDNWLRPIQ